MSIDADIVIKSIGYKTIKMEGVPFDERRSTVPHEFGCVVENGKP